MKKILLSLVFIPSFVLLFGQSNLDSLWRTWNDPSVGDSLRVVALFNYSMKTQHIKPKDTIIEYANFLLHLVERSQIGNHGLLSYVLKSNVYSNHGEFDSAHHYYLLVAENHKENQKYPPLSDAYYNLGLICTDFAKYDLAQSYLEEALRIGEEHQLPQKIMKSLLGLGNLYLQKNIYEKAISFYLQCKEKATEINHLNIIAACNTNIGLIYTYQGDYTKAIPYYEEGIRISKQAGDKLFLANTYNNLGLAYDNLGDKKQAIQYFMLGLKIREELGNKKHIATSLRNIGSIYSELNDIHRSKQYALEALKTYESIQDKEGIAATSVNIGNLFRNGGQIDSALYHYQKGYEYAADVQHNRFMGSALNGIAGIYADKGDFIKALEFQQKSLDFARKSSDKKRVSSSLKLLSSIYRKKGELSLAIEYGKKSLTIAQEIGNKRTVEMVSNNLYYAYKQAKQTAKALEMLELSLEMEDSLKSEDNQREVLRQEYKYEYEKQALADSLAFIQQQTTLELAHQQEISKRNNWLFVGSLIAVVLFLFFRYRQQTKLQLEQAEQMRLAELDAVKTRLYTNITHEFRTPLTVIQGMARKVLEKPDKWLQQGTGMIERNSVQLINLVNQMLDLSKLESGKLQLQAVQADIIPFLYYVAEPFQTMAESKEISLQIHQNVDKLTMDFDLDRMTEIISNLLSNAIKFTPSGGRIDIQVLSDKDAFMLIIRDTGIGIPKDKLPYVFDRFYQVDDSPTRHNEGTGIGLALSKELVQLMGGRIQVSSQSGEGTEFTVTLPISQQAMVADIPVGEISHTDPIPAILPISQPQADHLPSNLPQVLLIEDNPDVVSYLSSCLEANYRISIARNGQEGIDKALELVPDLIISDVMMPEKDGFEVCYTLKQDIRTSHVPIIMLTAKADEESKLIGLRRGADAYLSKPFNEKELLIRIHNLLEVRNTLQNRYRSAPHDMDSPSTADIEKEDVFIQTVRQVIMSQLSNYQLDVPTLCKELGMTRTPLHNKLKALTGMSTTEFMRYVRLTHAQELLRETDMHVSEVAYATGFQNHTYFSRKFREVFGQTPKTWREET